MNNSVPYSAIASFLHKKVYGKEGNVITYSSLSEIKPSSVVFAKKYEENYLNTFNNQLFPLLAIVTPEYQGKLNCSYIISENPRLDYLRVIEKFFLKNAPAEIHSTAVIEENVRMEENVSIGAHCYIGKNVIIGKNTRILPHTTIMENTVIGANCYIKSGVVIGQPGFGFEREENGIPVHFPHTGNVRIGDDVYIGANTVIDQATLENTIIESHVKIDNLVHIAHNVHIEENTFVIAGTILGGGVHIGKNCWIAPNVSVKQQIKIQEDSLVGLGSVVLKNVEQNTVVAGNPARFLKYNHDTDL